MLRRAGIYGLEWQDLILTLMARSRSGSWLRRALRWPLVGHLRMVWSCQTEGQRCHLLCQCWCSSSCCFSVH